MIDGLYEQDRYALTRKIGMAHDLNEFLEPDSTRGARGRYKWIELKRRHISAHREDEQVSEFSS